MSTKNVDLKIDNDFYINGYLQELDMVVCPSYLKPIPGIGKNPSPIGYPGEYVVDFILQAPYEKIFDKNRISLLNHESSDSDLDNGTSLLKLTEPQSDKILLLAISDKNLKFIPNTDGYLGVIRITVEAENGKHAIEIAQSYIEPVRSRISFECNIPIEIARIQAIEQKTNTIFSKFLRLPFRDVVLDDNKINHIKRISTQYHILAYYREALETTSPFYQYLSFYKAIQLVTRLRGKNDGLAAKSGLSPKRAVHKFNANDIIGYWHKDNTLIQKLNGWKFNKIIDEMLTPLRLKIAHELLDVEDIHRFSPEELINKNEVYRHLPIIAYIARTLIADELATCSNLKQQNDGELQAN